MDRSRNVQAEQTWKASVLSQYINSIDRLWSMATLMAELWTYVWFTKRQNIFSPNHPFSWRNRVSHILLLESKSLSMTELIFVSGQNWWSLVCGTMWHLLRLQNISCNIVITKEMGWICPGIHSLFKKGSLYLHKCGNIYSRISAGRDQMVLKDI